MALLCIDVGNTSTHLGWIESGRVTVRDTLRTSELGDRLPGWLRHQRREQPVIEGAAYCSVVPAATQVVRQVLAGEAWPGHIHPLSSANCGDLAIDYPKPSEIGQDRLANALAARAFCPLPAVVIDLGTAVTFDIVSDRGYEGGIISPGIAIMTEYLHDRTALLPSLDPGDLDGGSAIGKSTVEAMRIGCRIGFGGMIGALLEAVESELQKRGTPVRTIVATGSSAVALPSRLLERIRVEPDFTLHGLHQAWQQTAGRA